MSKYILLEDGGKILIEDLLNSYLILEGAAIWQLRRKGSPAAVARITSAAEADRLASVYGVERITDATDADRITDVSDDGRITAPKGGE